MRIFKSVDVSVYKSKSACKMHLHGRTIHSPNKSCSLYLLLLPSITQKLQEWPLDCSPLNANIWQHTSHILNAHAAYRSTAAVTKNFHSMVRDKSHTVLKHLLDTPHLTYLIMRS